MTDPTAYGASWYAATAVAAPARGPLTIELDVDVCVIGGGLAGLTTAREVARRGWSVAVLEARHVAWNASGRNTGFVLPGFAADVETLVARVGLSHAKTLWALSESGAEYVRTAIRETRMPGVEYAEGGWLHVSKTDDDAAVADRAAWLADQFGAAVKAWTPQQVRAVLPSPRYFSAVHYQQAFSIHPLNYALGLAAAAEAAGARIFEETPALEIDPVGVRKRITTPSGRVRASHVVVAGNVHAGRLMPRLARTLVPISTYVITTAPLGEKLRDTLTFPGTVSDTERADNHYRVVGGDRLMWAGRCTLWQGEPRRYVDALVADIRRVYPQLGDVRAEYAWTGVLGNTVHRMPQIGELSPGLWVLSGFGGHGLNTTAMGGEIVARGIVDGAETWRLFSPFALVWAGGVLGRAAVQSRYWSHRWVERWTGWRSRRRDAARARTIRAEPLTPVATSTELTPPVAEPATKTPRTPRKKNKAKAGPRKKTKNPKIDDGSVPNDGPVNAVGTEKQAAEG